MTGFALYVLVRRCDGGSNGMGSVLELIMEGGPSHFGIWEFDTSTCLDSILI